MVMPSEQYTNWKTLPRIDDRCLTKGYRYPVFEDANFEKGYCDEASSYLCERSNLSEPRKAVRDDQLGAFF